MPRESRDKPNALNQALEEFLTAEQARPAPAPKPASGAAAGAPAAPGGTTRLPANAVHRASKPQEEPSLRQAYDKVLEDDAAKKVVRPAAPPTLWQRIRRPAILCLATVAAIYVWFGEPGWLQDSEHARLSIPRTGVSAKRQMAAIALEIEDYHRNTGRLPESLAAMGLDLGHVRYTPLPDGRFELSVGSGPHTARYRGTINGVDSLEAH